MHEKLDAKNNALLAAIEEDGRASFAQIGRTIRASKEVVAYRFEKLKEKGILTRIRPVINYYALGYTCYSLLINLYRLEHNTQQEVITYLRSIPRVYAELFIQSHFDLEIIFWAKEEKEFKQFFREFTGKFSRHIRHKELFVITEIHAFSHRYLHKQQHSWHMYARGEKTIDKIDERILHELRKDARIDLIQLAKQVKVPVSTTRYHLRKLAKEQIIVGYQPVIDISKLGFSKYRVAVDLSEPLRTTAAATYAGIQPEVTRVFETIGRFDLFFEVHVRTIREIDAFMQRFREFVPEIWDLDVMMLKE